MALRTTEITVTFKHPSALASVDCPLPAGAYRLVIDEEEILGLSFLAFQRVGTTLHTPALAMSGRPHEAFLINAAELAAALQADGRPRTESH